MITIHDILVHFKSFPFRENEGLLVLGADDKAVSSYVHFPEKSLLLDALIRTFKKNPSLLEVCADAVKFASLSCPDKEPKLEPRLQKFLDKIWKDLENLKDSENMDDKCL